MEQVQHIAILCLTHRCNLNCVYCFEKKDSVHEMTVPVAFECVDKIIEEHCKNGDSVSINFFGGEPLLRFELIVQVFNYVQENYPKENVSFFISTNGTLLNEDMKDWFRLRKNKICLGLSLDGDRETQNRNRSNSFDKIDIDFFASTWPKQYFKLTLSEMSINNYAHDVMFIHSYGIGINGGDVCVGNYHWNNEYFLGAFAKQLNILIDYYTEHPDCKNNLFDLDLALCMSGNKNRKACGCGTSITYYESEGRKFPCTFLAPMAFAPDDIDIILKTDFSDVKSFTDFECRNSCFIYNICHTCAAENFLINRSFSKYNKRNCDIKKIVALSVAELQSRLIINNPSIYGDGDRLYYTIEAIKNIREKYLPQYEKYFKEEVENPK